jgi:hypothetical protein
MSDYLKCAIANKGTLAGYLLTATGVAMGLAAYLTDSADAFMLGSVAFSTGAIGAGINILTSFGHETLVAYRRTREHIQRTKTLDDRFYRVYRHTYCTNVGAKLAAREAGLDLLIEESRR